MTGTWWNVLGSTFYLSEAENSSLRGRYQTAVEAAAGEAGPDGLAPVIGIRHSGREPTFSMSTVWAGGERETPTTNHQPLMYSKDLL